MLSIMNLSWTGQWP